MTVRVRRRTRAEHQRQAALAEAIVDMSAAEISDYFDQHVTTLPQARTALKRVAIIAVAALRQGRRD